MTKDQLKTIINKHVGYAELEIYDAIDEYTDTLKPNHIINEGWDCPTSPTGHCDYSDEDWGEDSCIYCGQPEERK